MKTGLLMRVPRSDEAVVPLQKLTNYLLSEKHPVGSSKAAYFRSLGFCDVNAPLLKDKLLTIIQNENIVDVVSSIHGTKYVVDGAIETPRGESVPLRTVWIVERNEPRPRFVTAYPAS